MHDQAVFTVEVYPGDSLSPALLKQYGKLRYQCFAHDDPYVNMNHREKTELDHFDTRATTWHVIVCKKAPRRAKSLVSAVRLIPTTEPYDLQQPSWSYLTDSIQLPRQANVVEGSRWVGKSSRTYEGTLSTALLMLKLYQLSREQGFDQMIGVIAAKGEAWLRKREAGETTVESRHLTQRDGEIMVTRMALDEYFLSAARQMMLQSLDFCSVSEISVSSKNVA